MSTKHPHFQLNSPQRKNNNPARREPKYTGLGHFPGQFPHTYSLTFTTHPSPSVVVDSPRRNVHPLLTQWQDFCCSKNCHSHYMVQCLYVNEYNASKQCRTAVCSKQRRSIEVKYTSSTPYSTATTRQTACPPSIVSSTALYTELKSRPPGQAASILHRCSISFIHSFIHSIMKPQPQHARTTDTTLL